MRKGRRSGRDQVDDVDLTGRMMRVGSVRDVLIRSSFIFALVARTDVKIRGHREFDPHDREAEQSAPRSQPPLALSLRGRPGSATSSPSYASAPRGNLLEPGFPASGTGPGTSPGRPYAERHLVGLTQVLVDEAIAGRPAVGDREADRSIVSTALIAGVAGGIAILIVSVSFPRVAGLLTTRSPVLMSRQWARAGCRGGQRCPGWQR